MWEEVEGRERWRKIVRGRGGVDDRGGRVWLLVVGGRKDDSWEGVSRGGEERKRKGKRKWWVEGRERGRGRERSGVRMMMRSDNEE